MLGELVIKIEIAMDTKKKMVEKILEEWEEQTGCKTRLYGSIARDEPNPHDIDIFIWGKVNENLVESLALEIKEETGLPADIHVKGKLNYILYRVKKLFELF